MNILAILLIALMTPVLVWMIATIIKWHKEDKRWDDCFSKEPMTDEEFRKLISDAADDVRILKSIVKGKS